MIELAAGGRPVLRQKALPFCTPHPLCERAVRGKKPLEGEQLSETADAAGQTVEPCGFEQPGRTTILPITARPRSVGAAVRAQEEYRVELPISRAVVQRICDERADLVPYLVQVIDSLERYGGLYQEKLLEVMPPGVVSELSEWLQSHLNEAGRGRRPRAASSGGIAAGLSLLERIFPEAREERPD